MRAVLLILVLVMPGCCVGVIQASEVDATMRRVIKRHQAYVRQDETIKKDLERRVALRDGEVLLETLDAAKEAAKE